MADLMKALKASLEANRLPVRVRWADGWYDDGRCWCGDEECEDPRHCACGLADCTGHGGPGNSWGGAQRCEVTPAGKLSHTGGT